MAEIGGRQPYSITIKDYDGETQALRLYTGEITVGTLAGLLTQLGTFKTALNAIILGVLSSEHWGEKTVISNLKATDKDAQVQTDMLVRCHGATSEAPYSFRIPTVDPEAFNYLEGNVVLSGAGATVATTDFITALQATFKMPDDENEGIIVDQMRIV